MLHVPSASLTSLVLKQDCWLSTVRKFKLKIWKLPLHPSSHLKASPKFLSTKLEVYAYTLTRRGECTPIPSPCSLPSSPVTGAAQFPLSLLHIPTQTPFYSGGQPCNPLSQTLDPTHPPNASKWPVFSSTIITLHLHVKLLHALQAVHANSDAENQQL